jgi:hypothetical protein
VVILEGEKKTDILAALELVDDTGKRVAVTTTGGATSWRVSYAEHFVGKRVLLLPDSDEPGSEYCEKIADSLSRLGIEFQIVRFDEYGIDVRDFLEQHPSDPAMELVEYMQCPWLKAPDPALAIAI